MKKKETFLDAVKLVLTTHTNDADRSPKSLLHLQLNSEAEVGSQSTRTLKPFTGLHRNTMVWKDYVEFGWKVPRSRPESNQTRISYYPPIIPPLFWHYPGTIWRRRSESIQKTRFLTGK